MANCLGHFIIPISPEKVSHDYVCRDMLLCVCFTF